MRILVANVNTTESMTEGIAEAARFDQGGESRLHRRFIP